MLTDCRVRQHRASLLVFGQIQGGRYEMQLGAGAERAEDVEGREVEVQRRVLRGAVPRGDA